MDRIINVPVKLSRLSDELDIAFPFKFEKACRINNTTTVSFSSDLTAQEIQEFNQLVVDHDPTVKEYRIYEYLAQNGYSHDEKPYGINYKTQLSLRLQQKHTIIKGELTKTEYFVDREETIPVLEVQFTWVRDSFGIVSKRESRIYYRFKDGTLDTYCKYMEKYYNGFEAIAENKRRRTNIVNQLEISVLGAMSITILDKTEEEILDLGKQWLSSHELSLSKYVTSGDTVIIDEVTTDQTFWLSNEISPGVTIKQFVISELTI